MSGTGRQSDSGATPSGHGPPSLGQAPSPSSEGPAEEGVATGWRTSTSGGRNLDTAFESALTDCRRKRLRADESPHNSGGTAQTRKKEVHCRVLGISLKV